MAANGVKDHANGTSGAAEAGYQPQTQITLAGKVIGSVF